MHIVLLEPEIHWNTGNIGRTCVGTGTALHLVGPLGFSLDEKEVRRAGLDYWPKVDLRLYKGWGEFEADLPKDAELLFFSSEAEREFWDAPFTQGCYLVFGRESTGLPEAIRAANRQRLYRIPQNGEIRSLNLSTAAGIVLFEGLRRLRRV